MQQYPVPQFIDVEDKIIGPFTLKQFGFIFGAGILLVAIFRLAGFGIIFFLLGIPIALVAGVLAFGSFNGRPMYNSIGMFMKSFGRGRQMVFVQNKPTEDIIVRPLTAEMLKDAQQEKPVIEEPVGNRLKKLSLLLDQKNQEEEMTINARNRFLFK